MQIDTNINLINPSRRTITAMKGFNPLVSICKVMRPMPTLQGNYWMHVWEVTYDDGMLFRLDAFGHTAQDAAVEALRYYSFVTGPDFHPDWDMGWAEHGME